MSDAPEKLDLTFIVIAYNEEGSLKATVDELMDWLKQTNRTAPVLIMDDGSTDRTAEIADDLAEKYENVEVYHHKNNVGHSRNVSKGFELTKTKYVTILPGDSQLDVFSYDMFIPFIGKYDVIFGFPNNEYVRGRKRTLLSYGWRLFLLALFNISVTYLGGMKILSAELVRRMPISASGFLGSYERFIRIVLSGASYIQVPFTLRDRQTGDTKALNPTRNIGDLFRMLGIWWRIKGPGIFREGPEYQKIREIYRTYCNSLNEKNN